MDISNGWFFEKLNFIQLEHINELKDDDANYLYFKKNGTFINNRKIRENRYSKIPKVGGIYIYYDKYKVPIYIGRAQNLRTRHCQHMTDYASSVNKHLDEVEYYSYAIVEDLIKRNIYEMIYICNYKPKLNSKKDTGLSKNLY